MPVRRHPFAVGKIDAPLTSLPLDRALSSRLRETYDRVRQQDQRLAEVFYGKLFAAAPALQALFKSDRATQAAKLMAALDTVIANFEKPGENAATLAALGQRHAGYGAKPEHYALVVDLLVESMGELLGSEGAASPDRTVSSDDTKARLEEWRMALELISAHMIAATRKGG